MLLNLLLERSQPPWCAPESVVYVLEVQDAVTCAEEDGHHVLGWHLQREEAVRQCER